MKQTQEILSVKYSIRIQDPTTNRRCDVYVSAEWDLESLLLFLRSIPNLECDVRDVRTERLDP